jgi:hypothetical protein
MEVGHVNGCGALERCGVRDIRDGKTGAMRHAAV